MVSENFLSSKKIFPQEGKKDTCKNLDKRRRGKILTNRKNVTCNGIISASILV
jgi:hypothetical protein